MGIKFTAKEDKYIRENYLEIPVKRMAKIMGRSGFGVSNRLKILGLEIPAEIIEARKKASRFSPGIVPFTKGKKQHEFMSADAIERTKATRFVKGQKPHNTLHDGAITERISKSGAVYLFIRTGLGEWQPLQRYNWEKVNGPIAPGFNIVFKNSNPLQCNIENLECISDADLALRNTIHNLPDDLIEIIRLTSKLNRKIKKINQNG